MPINFDLNDVQNKYFVETGTYKGKTCEKVFESGLFDKVITIDIQKQFVGGVKDKFRQQYENGSFNPVHGASHEVLWDVIKNIDEEITFFLDAHVDGGGNLRLGSLDDVRNCPLYEELEIIGKHPIKTHTIMIDDIRIVRGAAWGRGSEISVDGLVERIHRINPDYDIGYGDGHIENDVLVAKINGGGDMIDKNAKIYVAGHNGMVGSAVIETLREQGYDNLITRSSSDLDLRDQARTRGFMRMTDPDVVILAAARVGGILANDQYPADFIYDNLAIEQNVIKAAHEVGVERLIFLGSSCIYPKHCPQPMKEDHLLTGPLEPTNQWYAVAKIAGIKLCQAFHKQHGDDFVSLMPTNLYGPRDNFNLETAHVLPAILRKFHEADDEVVVWGTGTPKREFLHTRDLADAIVHVMETESDQLWNVAPDGILNVGSGDEVSINELVELIRGVTDREDVNIAHDDSKPDGTPRKYLDTSRMEQLGWTRKIPLEQGIENTYKWYLNNKDQIRK